MHIVFLWKAINSGGGGCPALYKVDDEPTITKLGEGYVVQGKKLDPQTRAQLRQLLDDEDAVWVPADVIERVKDLG